MLVEAVMDAASYVVSLLLGPKTKGKILVPDLVIVLPG
jgi:hypothetical protein